MLLNARQGGMTRYLSGSSETGYRRVTRTGALVMMRSDDGFIGDRVILNGCSLAWPQI